MSPEMPQPRFWQSWHRSSTQPGWNLPFKTSFGDHLQGSPGDENDNDKYKVFQTGMHGPAGQMLRISLVSKTQHMLYRVSQKKLPF